MSPSQDFTNVNLSNSGESPIRGSRSLTSIRALTVQLLKSMYVIETANFQEKE